MPFLFAVLKSGDIDAELERLDYIHHIPVVQENPTLREREQAVAPAPRPLSPTRLQPVVAPEAQIQEIPDLEELLRIRAEIPRALKRRGSVDQSQSMKRASHYEPNQYKHLIDKLFRRKERRRKGEKGSETSSSSDGEDCATPPAPVPQTSTLIPHDFKVRHGLAGTDDVLTDMSMLLLYITSINDDVDVLKGGIDTLELSFLHYTSKLPFFFVPSELPFHSAAVQSGAQKDWESSSAQPTGPAAGRSSGRRTGDSEESGAGGVCLCVHQIYLIILYTATAPTTTPSDSIVNTIVNTKPITPAIICE